MNKTVSDARIPPSEQCVLPRILEHWSSRQPNALFVQFADGSEWTYAQALDISRRCAAGLAKLGVVQGDRVISWIPNSAEALKVWLGLAFLGAINVPVNTALRGKTLEHVVENSGARLAVVHAALYPRLCEINLAALSDAVVVGGGAAPIQNLCIHDSSALSPASDEGLPIVDVMPWDEQSVIYTSGTTGPSKGVQSSYLQGYSSAAALHFLKSTDRFLITLPLFHVAGIIPVLAMTMRGGSCVLVEAFDVAGFWDLVRRTKATTTILLMTMAAMLREKAPAADDRDHSLRLIMVVPLTKEDILFRDRYGCDLATLFTMTETSMPLISSINPEPPESCGQVRGGAEVRIVDENDCEVPVGSVGQLIIRTDAPWGQNHGYLRNPAATAEAWRNGWFHTGDAFRCDDAGNYYFVDRFKDSIRRRGENISSFEVEAEVSRYPGVAEVAAVGVPSKLGEEEVLVAVVLHPGSEVNLASMIETLSQRMPRYMVPRYVRLVSSLPKTQTHKIQKHILRSEGVTSDTWDREANGIVLRRDRLTSGRA